MTTPDPGLPELIEWLASDDCHDGDDAGLVVGLGRRLRAMGLPVDRFSLHVRTLHPEILARTIAWSEGEPVDVRSREHGVQRLPAYLDNPIRAVVVEGREWLSLRSEDGRPLLDDLDVFQGHGLMAMEGAPLVMAHGRCTAAVFATKRPEGFGPDGVALLRRLAPALRGACEIRVLRRTEATLLDTYLGPQSGEQILAGHVRRGDVQTLEAALLLCDLRDFTTMSNRLPPAEMLDRLNLYFDQVVPAIEANGGEILKFMGDGVLAFFHRDAGPSASCTAAFDAARRALDHIAALPRVDPPLVAGIALHHGQVAYGNIGSGHRLDFTVIGRDVNLVSRIQGICGSTGEPLLMSARFAQILDRPGCRPVGRYPLRGFGEPAELFAAP